MNFLQVAQHAANDFARRRGLQVQPHGHLKLFAQAAALAKRLQPLGQFFAAKRLTVEGVNQHLALGQVDLDHEMPRKRHAARVQPQPDGQLQPQHGQRDWNAAPRAHHGVEVAVVGVVVVVDVAAKAQVAKEKLVQRAQALQLGRVARQPALEAGQQLVNIAQHLFDIQVGVFVLRQADGGLQQRKVRIALHQA